MTSEEILDLEQEDLNYAVAIEIFEYQPDMDRPGRFLRGNTSFCPRDYSKDIHAAFDIVKAMRKRGWLFTLSNEGVQWGATFYREETNSIRVVKATAESAICKAALLVVSREEQS